MGEITKIPMYDSSHNFWTGCTKISEGCKNCYMFRAKKRYGHDPENISEILNFDKPLKWKEPKRIFVNSWSDFYHEAGDKWRNRAFNIMKKSPQHTYCILTKRPDRILMNTRYDIIFNNMLKNIWWGVTIENMNHLDRYYQLESTLTGTNQTLLFVSIEPMLSEMDLGKLLRPHKDHGGLTFQPAQWVIVGTESGGKNIRRPAKIEWVESIVEQCKEFNVPVFVKQLEINGKVTDDINLFPEHLRIQQIPEINE